jgi:hypothetical protein
MIKSCLLGAAIFASGTIIGVSFCANVLRHDEPTAVSGPRWKSSDYAFGEYMGSHSDTPSPEIRFPNVPINPEIWDWTWHAVLRGETKVEYWKEAPQTYANNTVVSTSGSGSGSGWTQPSSIFYTTIPTITMDGNRIQ